MTADLSQKLRELQNVIGAGGVTRLSDMETLRQAADALEWMQAPAEGDATWQNIEGVLRTAVGTHAMLGNKALEAQAREALEQFRALPKPQPKGMPADWRDAMQEALSVCDSVSMSRDRRVVREGCVLYLQTEEWCKWAEQEVAPKLRHALKAVTVQAPAPGADVEGGDLPCPRCNGSGFELQWSDASPDAHQVEVNCDHCDGAGSLGAAYTHLSQMLKSERERSKKHTDELHWLKSGPFFGLRADKSVQTVADRLDELADACGKYDPRSERASDIRAAATIWRKHLAGPAPCAAVGDGQ